MVTGATAFWVVVPCRLVKFYGRFVCACCLRYEGSEPYEPAVGFCQTTGRRVKGDSRLLTEPCESLKSHCRVTVRLRWR